jgi:hypothetical protein
VAYFADLTFYTYFGGLETTAKNIGWLQRGHAFPTAAPSGETLDLLWQFCSVPVMKMRGVHVCDLCEVPQASYAERNGKKLLLGHSEIRAFSAGSNISSLRKALEEAESGGLIFLQRSPVPFSIYAAPTLIYHYVEAHHYKPPEEFQRALCEGPQPTSPAYFELLRRLNIAHDGFREL